MKKLTVMLALVALVGNIANAELLKNFKYTGSIEAAGIVANNATDFNSKAGDKFGDVKNRVMIGAGFDLNEDVSANVSVNKCDRSYGQASQTVAAGTADGFLLDEAYLTLKNVFGLNHKVGRQYYGNDSDIVLYYGPANWYTRGLNANNVAFDGWTSTWSKNKLAINALLAKLTETAVAPGVTNTDKDLYGLTASYDFNNEFVKPSMYIYEQKDRSGVSNKLNNLEVLGVKATGSFKGINYKGEFAMNMGNNSAVAANTDNKYRGSAIKLNADYAYDFMGKAVLMVEIARGSGDKTAGNSTNKGFMDINANYRPGLIMGGVGVTNLGPGPVAITNLNNLTTWNLGANWTPEKENRLNLEAKYYDFSNTEKNAAGAGGASRIGGEADLVTTWTHSQNVALKLGLGAFMPTKKFANAAVVPATGKTDVATLASLYMNVKF